MLNRDYTAKLLDLKDVIITKIENTANQLHIHLELPAKPHTCPACGAETDCVHDYRTQTVKDVPLARDTFPHLRKRRYRCACGKRFFEENVFLGRERLKDWLVSVELMEPEEFRNSARACRNWFREILNSMDVPWTNGFVEGCNNKTKVLKRVCFGMRNFSNFRKRILFANT